MFKDGTFNVLALPRLGDGMIDELLKLFDHLPEKISLVLDPHADYVRILSLNKAAPPQLSKRAVVEGATALGMPDQARREAPQPKRNSDEDRNTAPRVLDDLVLVVHRVQRSSLAQ